MAKRTVVTMPGDGIGQVVLPDAIRVLEAAGFEAEWVHADIGWEFVWSFVTCTTMGLAFQWAYQAWFFAAHGTRTSAFLVSGPGLFSTHTNTG